MAIITNDYLQDLAEMSRILWRLYCLVSTAMPLSANTERHKAHIPVEDRHQTRMQVRVWEQKYETVITVTLCYKPAESLKPILSFQQAPAILLLPQHNWAPCGSKLHSWKDPVEQSSSEQNPGICQRSKHTNSFSLQIRKKTSSTRHFFRSVQKLESVH